MHFIISSTEIAISLKSQMSLCVKCGVCEDFCTNTCPNPFKNRPKFQSARHSSVAKRQHVDPSSILATQSIWYGFPVRCCLIFAGSCQSAIVYVIVCATRGTTIQITTLFSLVYNQPRVTQFRQLAPFSPYWNACMARRWSQNVQSFHVHHSVSWPVIYY